jgi:hypothetical protein
VWTPKQAERVLQLAAEGVSQRAIAEEVFGNARLHGRVERIVGGPAKQPVASEGEPLELESVLPKELLAPELRRLFGFYDEVRKRTGAEPSMADLERLLRIHLRLQALAQVERLNAITRDRDGLRGFLEGLTPKD